MVKHGSFQGRIEDARFVTGAGAYVSDLRLPNTAHAFMIRSPVAHADIRSVDGAAAAAMPGVLGVFTGADLSVDGVDALPCGVQLPRLNGDTAYQAAKPILARGRVRHVGEAVAFVVAETRAEAEDAAMLVDIDYDELPAVVMANAARAADAPKLWDEVEDNVAYVWERGDKDAAKAAVDGAAHKVSLRSHITRALALSLETRGGVGEIDDQGRYVLHASNQSPHALKGMLATVLGVEKDQVRVIARDVGGAFGMKSGAYVEDLCILWAAKKFGRPVSWISDRSEGFLSDDHSRDVHFDATLGFDDEGIFQGLTVHFDINIGAYLSGRSLGSLGNLGGISGVYRTPHVAASAYGVHSNTTMTAPYRGAGRPEATFVIERLADLAARKLGIDPFELRLKNLVPESAMPYHTGFLFEYDSGNFEANMRGVAELGDRDGFAARKAEAEARGRLLGLGYANPIEVSGGPFVKPGADHSRVEVRGDGSAVIYAGAMSTGQGLHTAFTELVVEKLGIDPAKVDYRHGDTDDLPGGRGSGGSASAPTGGSAMVLAMDDVIEKGKAAAGEMLEVAAADIEFDQGVFSVAGTDRKAGIAEVAASVGGEGLKGASLFNPEKVTFPNGCHLCEVEVDPETGAVEVKRYSIVEDVGRVLNRTLLTGQMHGGVAQGAGQSLAERMVYAESDGQPLSGTFMDYQMPRADMMPEPAIRTREIPTEVNPIGAKGVGEAGTVGSLVAVINAITDALAPLGVDHIEMPATPDRVWRAIRDAKGGS